MYLYIYIYIHVHVHIHVLIFMYILVCIIFTNVHVHIFECTYMYLSVYLYICKYVYFDLLVHVCFRCVALQHIAVGVAVCVAMCAAVRVAVCVAVLQCFTEHCRVWQSVLQGVMHCVLCGRDHHHDVLTLQQRAAVCCSVLQCAAYSPCTTCRVPSLPAHALLPLAVYPRPPLPRRQRYARFGLQCGGSCSRCCRRT